MELENQELLALIRDDMYIISYMTKKWCKGRESQEENRKKESKKLTPANTGKGKSNPYFGKIES